MKCCILMASPRKNGNTAALLRPFTQELAARGAECAQFALYDRKLEPCVACRACQADWSVFGCPRADDMQQIFDAVLTSELIVLATPIYSWFCTPPMKAVLDRLVYGMNKYYSGQKGPSLWAGKRMAAVVTCGYRPEQGADLFQTAMERYCKHSALKWLGMHCERHLGYNTVFMDDGKEQRARAYAGTLWQKLIEADTPR